MTKRYGEQTFTLVNANGKEFEVYCYTTDTRNGFCHTAKVDDTTVKVSYYNRTWECFKYETALKKLINKIAKGKELELLQEQLKAIANHERIEADKWFNRMETMWNNLSDNGKERVTKVVDDNELVTTDGIETALTLATVLGL